MQATLIDRFLAGVRINPAAPAIIADGRVISHQQLLSLVGATARRLHDEGLRSGAIVGVSMEQGPLHCVAVLALARLGVVSVTIAPTVVVDPEPNGRVVREESFGPVVVLLGIRDLAHGIALCNSVPQGLVATIYTGDTQAQQRFAAEVEAGMVGINQARPRFAAAAPFFGWKHSAIGLPEHGRWDRDFYTRTKAIYDAV